MNIENVKVEKGGIESVKVEDEKGKKGKYKVCEGAEKKRDFMKNKPRSICAVSEVGPWKLVGLEKSPWIAQPKNRCVPRTGGRLIRRRNRKNC